MGREYKVMGVTGGVGGDTDERLLQGRYRTILRERGSSVASYMKAPWFCSRVSGVRMTWLHLRTHTAPVPLTTQSEPSARRLWIAGWFTNSHYITTG